MQIRTWSFVEDVFSRTLEVQRKKLLKKLFCLCWTKWIYTVFLGIFYYNRCPSHKQLMKVFFCKRIIIENNSIYAENIFYIFNLFKILMSFHSCPYLYTSSYPMKLLEKRVFSASSKEYLIIGLSLVFSSKKGISWYSVNFLDI